MFRFNKGEKVSVVGLDSLGIISYPEISSGYDGYRLETGEWVYDDLCSMVKESNQLTLEELRDQFEARFEIKEEIINNHGGIRYMKSEVQADWFIWQQCAKANNVLREE